MSYRKPPGCGTETGNGFICDGYAIILHTQITNGLPVLRATSREACGSELYNRQLYCKLRIFSILRVNQQLSAMHFGDNIVA